MPGRLIPWGGHRDFALAGHGTACPGDQWAKYRRHIQRELTKMADLEKEVTMLKVISELAALIRLGQWQEAADKMAYFGIRAR